MRRWSAPQVVNALGARPLTGFGWAANLDASLEGHTLRLGGWVLSAAGPVSEVWLELDGTRHSTALTLDSPDIAAAYPGAPGASRCRLSLNVALPEPGVAGGSLLLYVCAQGPAGLAGATAPMHLATVLCRSSGGEGHQVFVVGSPRSGTTVVGNALRAAVQSPNYGEAHVLPLLRGLVEALDTQFTQPAVQEACQSPENMVAHLAPDVLREGLASQFRTFYHQLNGGPQFVDKTPGVPMLRSLHVAHWVWPQARFVFCHRRGLDNVASRMRKFVDQSDFEGHCGDWAMAMKVWQEAKAVLPAHACYEIEQMDIARQPRQTGERLSAWLGLDAAQTQGVVQYFQGQRPEKTGTDADQQVLDVAQLNWSPEQLQTFRRVCGEMMDAYGYLESAAYRR